MRAWWHQTKLELRLTLRRGEAVLLTLVVPVGLLAFFGSTGLFGLTVDFLVPGLMALSIISSAFVSLAVATGFERKYLVLKRLGASPLSRSALIAAKASAVLVLEVLQFAALVATARILFDWRPAALSWVALVAVVLAGTLAFAGLAMLVAGVFRAEATLAIANGLYVVFLGFGDVFIPASSLPGRLAGAVDLLPAGPLAAGLRAAFEGGRPDWAWLIAWAIVTPLLAARLFTWQER